MEISMLDAVIMGIGFAALLVWLVFYLKGRKYNSMFDVLEEKEYPLKEIYGLGYGILESFHYQYKSKADRDLRQDLEVLYGEKYCEYYLRVVQAQKLTLSMTLLPLAFAVYGLTSEIAALGVMLMFVWLAYYYYGTLPKKKIQERSDELLHDFSEVVSKLALLTNAGMILREAWQEVAVGGDSIIYREMRKTVVDMENGTAEIDAIYEFGCRCIIPEIKKFTTTVIQGMTMGNRELTLMLQQQSKEVWQLKKQLVRREGERASSKLMIPICIMFVGILVMILVPIFTNLGV